MGCDGNLSCSKVIPRLSETSTKAIVKEHCPDTQAEILKKLASILDVA
jgi:hypothetical protein